MENIQKMGLSYGLQGGGEGGDVFGEALGFGEHTTSSLEEGCKVGCHMGGVENRLGEGGGDLGATEGRNVIGEVDRTRGPPGAKARIHRGRLRGAEAPLFHGSAGLAARLKPCPSRTLPRGLVTVRPHMSCGAPFGSICP